MNTVKKYAPPDVKSLLQSTMKMWLNAQKTKCEGLDTCDLSLKTGDALERENQEAKEVGKAELQKHLEEGGTEYMVTTKKELTGVTLKFCQDNVDKFETDLRNGGGSPLRLSITFAEISSRMLESHVGSRMLSSKKIQMTATASYPSKAQATEGVKKLSAAPLEQAEQTAKDNKMVMDVVDKTDSNQKTETCKGSSCVEAIEEKNKEDAAGAGSIRSLSALAGLAAIGAAIAF